ncbi:MAG TPA: hypothetical protein VH877_14800 [Polyangia bacterium]|jgi:hypothetical protein|nr:hypothetical protein [Polyangia bacterium]
MAQKHKRDYVVLSGRIEDREPIGIGGEAPPAGSYLVLDQPLRGGRSSIKEVFLLGRRFADGEHKKLYGRLGEDQYGGVETAKRTYFVLSGISDLDAGEPYFDGVEFHSATNGEVLPVLMLVRQDLFDAPNQIAVLDRSQGRAFIGFMGGFILPTANPFHGFQTSVPIEAPTEADRAAVQITEQALPISAATGEPMAEAGRVDPPPHTADAFTYSWYFDAATGTVYGFVSGGIAGFVMHLDTVIRTGLRAGVQPAEPVHP